MQWEAIDRVIETFNNNEYNEKHDILKRDSLYLIRSDKDIEFHENKLLDYISELEKKGERFTNNPKRRIIDDEYDIIKEKIIDYVNGQYVYSKTEEKYIYSNNSKEEKEIIRVNLLDRKVSKYGKPFEKIERMPSIVGLSIAN